MKLLLNLLNLSLQHLRLRLQRRDLLDLLGLSLGYLEVLRLDLLF